MLKTWEWFEVVGLGLVVLSGEGFDFLVCITVRFEEVLGCDCPGFVCVEVCLEVEFNRGLVM